MAATAGGPDHGGTARPRAPGKNIVLCSDGTGNSGGKARGTNVWAIFNAVWRQPDADGNLPPRTQVTFYDDGVGTQKFRAFKMLGGAFGWGYSRNIRDLYRALVSAYEPGDSIYLFGFSRGAYTVRGLAGMICKHGILNRHRFATSAELDYAVWAVFRAYRDGYESILGRLRRWLMPGYATAYAAYKTDGKLHDLDAAGEPASRLRFIGVWDTVDAVGLPFDKAADWLDRIVRFRFSDKDLHPRVDKACHAISIDDERHTFWPVMWNEAGESDPGRIEQVWFAGAHSNVGGGYPKDQVALVALDWMMARASAAGLGFYADVLARVREDANAHGRHYDSRAGKAAFYRYRPRDMSLICDDAKAGVSIERPKLHMNALRRAGRATDDYAPAGLAETVEVVGSHAEDAPLAQRLAEIYAAGAAERAVGFGAVARVTRRRRWLYWLFVGYATAILAAAGWFALCAQPLVASNGAEPPFPINYLFKGLDSLLPDYVFGVFRPLLDWAKVHWVAALAALAVLLILVILKARLEGQSRRLALDSWRAFREQVYPETGAGDPGAAD